MGLTAAIAHEAAATRVVRVCSSSVGAASRVQMPLNFGPTLEGDVERIVFGAEALRQKCMEFGAAVTKDYADKNLLVVAALT